MKREITKVGLFGIGLDTYWLQFDGLLSKLTGYQKQIKDKIEGFGVEVVDAGMVDNPIKAGESAELFMSNHIDVIFLYVSTYALSSSVLPIVRRIKVPVIILNLQPVAQLDYAAFNKLQDRGFMTGIWLENCQACSVPELSSVFNRTGVPYHIITGHLEDRESWDEIEEWIIATRVAGALCNNTLGIVGHYFNGMLDVYSDLTKLSATFGTHIELLEMCELKKYRDEATETSIGVKNFINQWSKGGPAHHCAIGLGHVVNKIEKLGNILGIRTTRIC
ncbi:MAG: hypothetical protein J7L89_09145 [Bacteroidales bacterium]|nr:hypothetical protein [Bacteroidales bacterium]